jgi:hypothetical protein
MEKKILSIDFDIVMFPSINLYNDDVDGDDNPIEIWKELEEEYGFEDYDLLKYDASTIMEVAKLMKRFKDKPIHFIKEHQQVVDILKEQPDYDNCQYHIYNVDHHHDLWYRKSDFKEILEQDKYDCADWLGYLYLKKKTASLTWLKAPNSEDLDIGVYGGDFKLNILKLRDFPKLYDIDFDEVYFCLSPQWIPKKFKIFYDLIQLFTEEEK